MSNRFYPGDPCPECAHSLERHGRSIWTMFLRESFLKCSNCKVVFTKRVSTAPLRPSRPMPTG